ncbi:MAG: thermonuclease family protein [Dichotomicrobium sp.]
MLSSGPARASCELRDAGEATVVEILNTESLLLEDGRAIRLIGALAPRTQTRWAETMDLKQTVITELKERLLGAQVRLRFGGRERDRYGRLLTHVFVKSDDDPVWVQEALIRDGLAMAYSFADNRACLRRLLKAEARAREHNAGLWKKGLFRVRDAADPESMETLAYSFQIVEGRVKDVAVNRGRIYINFGEDWRTDVTATVDPSDRDNFADSDIRLRELEGRTVRVRGWLGRRNGPIIDVTHPEQIELVAARDSAAPSAE